MPEAPNARARRLNPVSASAHAERPEDVKCAVVVVALEDQPLDGPRQASFRRRDDFCVFDWISRRWTHAHPQSESLEDRMAILERADVVWVNSVDGRVEGEAVFVIGFAQSHNVPVFARVAPEAEYLRKLVIQADSMHAAAAIADAESKPLRPRLRSFQRYYDRVSKRRGYDTESARDAVLLLTEEVGELARAVRKSEGLVRHGGYHEVGVVAAELADIFLYLVHLSNIIGVDLGCAVEDKERVNDRRFLESVR